MENFPFRKIRLRQRKIPQIHPKYSLPSIPASVMEANQHTPKSPRRFSENTVHFISCDAQETGGGPVPLGVHKRPANERVFRLGKVEWEVNGGWGGR